MCYPALEGYLCPMCKSEAVVILPFRRGGGYRCENCSYEAPSVDDFIDTGEI